MSCTCEVCSNEEMKQEDQAFFNQLEYTIGVALNTCLTNAYKRTLMKSIVDRKLRIWQKQYPHPEKLENYEEKKQQWKKDVLDSIEKFNDMQLGLDATKLYVELIVEDM